MGRGGVHHTELDIPRYLKNNIHCQQRYGELRASYINWTDPAGIGHVIIPVNTPVIVDVSRRYPRIETQNIPKKTIIFELDKGRIEMSSEQYINIITSPQPTDIERRSAIDRKGIQEGKVYEGMTKERVRIALGYPAAHKTPSLDSAAWWYWTNMDQQVEVHACRI
ncbi:MAG: hypothetical protein LBQ00_04200 [Syntrophobacterales bacterium]|nr:hypothetical protein [Syntrophobacterales bacterium]